MRHSTVTLVALIFVLAMATPTARGAEGHTALGIYQQWGAFYAPDQAHCYAIAMAETEEPNRNAGRNAGRNPRSDIREGPYGYASIAYWPKANIRGQFYVRLPHTPARGTQVKMTIGRKNFTLIHKGNHAWARNAKIDTAIIAALRSSLTMRLTIRQSGNTATHDSYPLRGASSAIDAAALRCITVGDGQATPDSPRG